LTLDLADCPTVTEFLQTLTTTITVGSLYALLALGYTLVYGVLKFINFAHSDIFVLGAWTGFTAATVIGTTTGASAQPWWSIVVVLLLAIAVCGTMGYVIERFAYRPLRKAPRLNVLITAIGVSLLLQNTGQLTGGVVARDGDRPLATVPFGATPKSMPALLPTGVLNDTTLAEGTLSGGSRRGFVKLDAAATLSEGRTYQLEVLRVTAEGGAEGQARREVLKISSPAGTYGPSDELQTQPRRNPADMQGASYRLVRSPTVAINLVDVIIVALAVAIMLGLEVLVFRTRFGRGMRALSFNVDNAALMGINVNAIISLTFVLGTALAAIAAVLYAQKYPGLNQPAHQIWVLLGLKAFVAAVVGGIGNIRGAVLGGFLIAGIEFFGGFYSDRIITSLGGKPGLGISLQDVYVFTVLIAVLLLRPNGLLGAAVREKV
jgi:branched-chain amino acid transport system permease protein